MKQLLRSLGIVCLILFVSIIDSAANSVDEYIKDLKNADPEIRAKAAFELGCS